MEYLYKHRLIVHLKGEYRPKIIYSCNDYKEIKNQYLDCVKYPQVLIASLVLMYPTGQFVDIDYYEANYASLSFFDKWRLRRGKKIIKKYKSHKTDIKPIYFLG